jgi:hypothetical protein
MATIKDNYGLRLSKSDIEQIEFVLNSHDIPFDEKTSGVKIFRDVISIAYDKSKPKEVIPSEISEKVKALETENESLKLVLTQNVEKYNDLLQQFETAKAGKAPDGAIVLNFSTEEKQKLVDVYDLLVIEKKVESYEQLIINFLNTLQKGNLFVLDENDYETLKKIRNNGNA